MSNIFAPEISGGEQSVMQPAGRQIPETRVNIPDYKVNPNSTIDSIIAFCLGFILGFAIVFVFYKIIAVSLIGASIFGIANIIMSGRNAIKKRRNRLRIQFYDLLEAMSVAMRAGNPPLKALESAREDLSLTYAATSDIIIELEIMIGRFNNAVSLSEIFNDLAERSGLEDIKSFASIYATIEGKSSRADEIVRETQQIIADKMEIEMEIDTMMTAAKNELNVMLLMPIVILLIISFMGAGFIDAIYTEPIGRAVATLGLGVLVLSYAWGRSITNIKL